MRFRVNRCCLGFSALRLRPTSVVIAAVSLFAATLVSAASESPRRTLSLDGSWQIAEGSLDRAPASFDHTVPVPGLVSLAQPAFVEPGSGVKDRKSIEHKDPRRDAFWYRRTFRVDGEVPAVAVLKIGKAMFGARVILNDKIVGDHQPSFTPGYFDVRAALTKGENELLVRIGADRDALPPGVPDGFDFEKTRYIPGIFDSVELILSGTPHIVNLQVAPDFAGAQVRLATEVRNAGAAAVETKLSFVVREAKSGRVVARAESAPISLAAGAEERVDMRIPLAGFRPWSPEDPFLYRAEVDSGADRFETAFGMRSFEFDPKTKRAMLNGRPYFMRGSNVTIYRFFEDEACGALPWDESWVRQFHRKMKEMHWNSLRYCIGFPPEAWYRIADEEGILIQDEFPIWYGGRNWSTWPPDLERGEIAAEYTEWMRERWNHPSVVIWDASNETSSEETTAAVQQVRGLDLSHRPWDNSYGIPRIAGDVFESHPYHFQNPDFRLADLARVPTVPQGSDFSNPGDSPVIINEYGWLWLNRDGTPTTLTKKLYRNLLGPDSTTAQRRHLYATYLAAETEYWRSHRQAAAVMEFTALGYSRPDGQTSDHWSDVRKLEWEPEFFRYVRGAFAPVGLMVDFWSAKVNASEVVKVPVRVINDLDSPWRGSVVLRLRRAGAEKPMLELNRECSVEPFGEAETSFDFTWPEQAGACEIEAELMGADGEPVRSLREIEIESPTR
ncbi:MAG TPA: glycoside hydrolase family 2 TIM barrel-domain containing protein [Opitutaceae bacterium]|nr:glycoside hydrolase family 2 TIM barrel-domain containing protein [Opitutaceae bacterium]